MQYLKPFLIAVVAAVLVSFAMKKFMPGSAA